MVESLEVRSYLAAIANEDKIKVRLSTDPAATESTITVPFSERVTLASAGNIRIRGYASHAVKGRQKKLVIHVIRAQHVDDHHIALTIDRPMRKGGRIYFDAGSVIHQADGSNIPEQIVRSSVGLNQQDFTRAAASSPTTLSAFNEQAAALPITVNGNDGGRVFDGIGGVSASSSRLLYDYPEPQRRDLLDYLFKPNYGAALQILKVEIGGDVNSTDGSEASHMRTPTDLNYDRGYEWWLMQEAKARNPDIILAALEWGAPGWFQGGFWSQDNINYIIKWLDGAQQHGLTIDYVGGWNESGYDAAWFVALDEALAATHPTVKIIAADDLPHHDWRVATTMTNDPAFGNAVDVLGQHSPGGWRTLYQSYSSTAAAKALDKPLWASEQSALSHDVGGGPWARGLNRAYIDARITASMVWAPLSGWYANLPPRRHRPHSRRVAVVRLLRPRQHGLVVCPHHAVRAAGVAVH